MPAENRGYNKLFEAWGGDFWRVAHSVTFQYSEANPSAEERRVVRLFFSVFPDVLPCWRCGDHFKEHMVEDPLTDDVLRNRETLSRWLHGIHNKVNRGIGKPEITYEAAKRFYLHDARGGRLPRTPPLQPATASAILTDLTTTHKVLIGVGATILLAAITAGAVIAIKRRRKS